MTCFDAWSSDAASWRSLSGGKPATGRMSTIRACPCVSVPVLSMTSTRTRASASNALPPFTNTPAFAARDTPETMATGTARIRGHGVATTSTARARIGSPLHSQAPPASTTVNARNAIANRSASRAMGAFERWAASIRRTMPA